MQVVVGPIARAAGRSGLELAQRLSGCGRAKIGAGALPGPDGSTKAIQSRGTQSAGADRCREADLEQEPAVRLDYFEIVDPETLDPVDELSRAALVAVAAFVGKARLIDNITLGPQTA